jgi:uncharacterized membrane protein
MTTGLRTLYRYGVAALFVAVLAQIGAAGYGAFYVANKLGDKGDRLDHKGFEHGWDFHTSLGWFIVIAGIVLLLIALAARIGRPYIWFALGTAVALIAQLLLAWLGEAVPGAGFLHALNAFLILGLTGATAHRAWRRVRAIG